MTPGPWRRADGCEIDADRGRLDLPRVVAWLGETYWAAGLPQAQVVRSIAHSDVYGLYAPGGSLIGFARVVTDRSRFAWLSDVVIEGPWRGRGLGRWLVGTVLEDPRYADILQWLLATNDAHGLYAQLGFTPASPDRFMVRRRG